MSVLSSVAELLSDINSYIKANGIRGITGTKLNGRLVNIVDTFNFWLGKKVDAVTGKGLSTNDFTDELLEKLNSYDATALMTAIDTKDTAVITALRDGVAADGDTLKKLYTAIAQLALGSHYKGTHVSLAALTTALPTATSGDEALIDAGAGTDAQKAVWDPTDNKWVIAGGGTITLDAIPVENSINAVRSGGVFAALSNKVDKNGTDRLITLIEAAKVANLPADTNTVLGTKAAKVVTPEQTKALISDVNGNPVESTLLIASVVSTQQISVADIQVGETKLLTATKQADGTAAFTGAVNTLDKLVSSVWDTLLADTAAWVGDVLDLTGNNINGGLGQNGQEHQINGNFYLCISHVAGTTTSNGSARWVRNRSNDCLTTNAQDAAIVTLLQTESGWDAVTNTKIITTRSKVGSWYTTSTGYHYFCFAESGSTWYWRRIGQPLAEVMQITDATLIAEIVAHDFVTTPFFTPVATVKGSQGQEYCWITGGTTVNVAECKLFGANLYWYKSK